MRTPVVLAALGLVVAALTKNVLGWADLVVNRGLGADAVAAIALYQVAPVAAQTLPVALLLGLLIGLGRLRADAELLAIELAGIHPFRLAAPLLLLALPLAAGHAALTVAGVPAARRGLLESFERIGATHPTATLRAGVAETFGERQILAREVSADGRRLRGVLLWAPEVGETVFAESARVEAEGPGRARVEMHDVVILAAPGATTQVVRTGTFLTRLERAGALPFEVPVDDLEAARTAELLDRAREAPTPEEGRRARAQLHRRLALPAALPLFALLALPLALGPRGGSRAAGAATGLAGVVVYYGLVQLGNGLLRVPSVPVAAAVWLPDAVAAASAAALLWRRRAGAGIAPPAPRRLRRARAAVRAPRRRPLERYVLASHLQLVLLSLAALTIAYLAIDVMERLEWFARHGATFAEALHFYSARIVLLVARVVPMSLLLGTALLVGVLEVRGELLAMRSLGIAPARGLAVALLAALLWAPAFFALTEWGVPRSNARADRIKEAEIKDGGRGEESAQVWHRQGDELIHVDEGGLSQGVVRDLTVYRIGEDGLPTARIDAREARREGGGRWRLEGGRRIEITPTGVARDEPMETLRLAADAVGPRDPMHMGAMELGREIRRAEASGYDTTAWRVDWHRKLAEPLACVLLPALALLQALGARERRSVAGGIVASVVLGIGYLLLQDVTAALAYGGRVPPALAGWGPAALLAVLAVPLALRASR
jgi:lipopolysaccharide export system permease protein